jgi:hypothetical protein
MSKKRKRNKKVLVSERMNNPILAGNKNNYELTTTATTKDLTSDINIVSTNDYLEIYKIKSADEYIPMWRNLATQHIEVQEALEEIINDAVVVGSKEDILTVDIVDNNLQKISDNIKEKIVNEWKYLYSLQNLDENLEVYFRKFYIDGVLLTEEVFTDDKMKEGIKTILVLDPIGIVKEYNKKINKYVYYKKRSDVDFLGVDIFKENDTVWIEDQISSCSSGFWDEKNKLFMSYLNYAVLPINKLNALENSIIVYALTRSTERMIYYIDVGGMSEKKAIAKIKEVARANSSVVKYDPSTGSTSNSKDKIKLTKDIYLGRRNGEKGTSIENLSASDMNIGEMPMLDYFLDAVYRALKVPRLRRNKESTFQFGDSQEIEREEMSFFKFVTKLRSRLVHIFRNQLKKQLISKGICNEDEWNRVYKRAIKFVFQNNNDFGEMKRISEIRSRLEILSTISEFTLKDANDNLTLFSREWVMDNILNLTNEQKNEINKQIEDEIKKMPEEEVEETKQETKSVEIINEDEEFDDLLSLYRNNNKVEETAQEIKIDMSELETVKDMLGEGDELIVPKSGIKFTMENGELKQIGK